MEQLIGLVVLVVLVAGGFLLFNRLRATPEAGRAARVVRSRIDDVPEDRPREPTLETLLPGDAISFGDGTNGLVVSVLACREQVGPRQSLWRWSFLDDDRLVEAARDNKIIYDRSEVIYQGDDLFQQLVAKAEDGGILQQFEQSVRESGPRSRPVTLEYAGMTFRLRSSGTFTATAYGAPLGMVWEDIGPEAGENVYFEADAESGEQLLGVWTSHIVLLVGHKLGITDIEAIYPGASQPS